MTQLPTEPNGQNRKYDLEDRTEKFSASLIHFLKGVKITIHNENIIRQLYKAGTSVGANYREANGAESKKDFHHKIAICKKESKETLYWLKMLLIASPETEQPAEKLLREIKELILIFGKIHSTSK